MQIRDNVKATGEVLLQRFNERGELQEERRVKNLVVTTGKNYMASRQIDASAAVMGWMAIGSGAVAPAVGDAALGAELGRVALSSRTQVNGNGVQHVATFGAGVGTGSVTEAGIFNAAAAGTMLARVTFGVVTKGANDTIVITWTVSNN